MKNWITAAIMGTALTVSACDTMTTDQRNAAGAVAGGALGAVTADALGANPEWTLVAGLAGAAAGTMVARHENAAQCAYSRGDGPYYPAPCP